MVRFVIGPGDVVVPDIAGKLPGRGLWVTARREAVDLAVKKQAFARAAKAKALADPALSAQVEALLRRSVLSLLGFARKAGALIQGYDKVKGLLAEPNAKSVICALIEARDGAQDGRKSILAKARAMSFPVPVIGCLSAAELSMALGLEHVIHAALAPRRADAKGLVRRILDETSRLSGFTALVPEDWVPKDGAPDTLVPAVRPSPQIVEKA